MTYPSKNTNDNLKFRQLFHWVFFGFGGGGVFLGPLRTNETINQYLFPKKKIIVIFTVRMGPKGAHSNK
jgi:hypothetical protein